jgi:parvulin-like peptidyl-prolyl isomerase
MKLHAALAGLAALALGCGGGAESKPEPQPEAKPEVRPKRSGPEAEHILLAHVLIAFQGTGTKATRTQSAAEKLAGDVLAKARKGEDFNKLMRDFSDDQGDGVYGLANHKVNPVGDEHERRRMVAAFGDVGFQLEVGEVGMAVYDPVKSKYGWHIIKRLK